jgi:hypothetical protein
MPPPAHRRSADRRRSILLTDGIFLLAAQSTGQSLRSHKSAVQIRGDSSRILGTVIGTDHSINRMMSMILLVGIGLYALAGLVTALTFVTKGVTQVVAASRSRDHWGAHPADSGRGRHVALCALSLAQLRSRAMRRTQRVFHRWIWPLLGIAVAIGIILAFYEPSLV